MKGKLSEIEDEEKRSLVVFTLIRNDTLSASSSRKLRLLLVLFHLLMPSLCSSGTGDDFILLALYPHPCLCHLII